MTDEGVTPLRDMAVSMHELFAEYVAAGFSRAEIVALTSSSASAGARMPRDD